MKVYMVVVLLSSRSMVNLGTFPVHCFQRIQFNPVIHNSIFMILMKHTRYHIHRNDNLALHTMGILQQVISHYNAYTLIYQHAYEILRIYDAPDYTVNLCVAPGNDP